jgi:membrane protein
VHPVTRRIVQATPAVARRPVRIVGRTIEEVFHDRVPGLAAEIAFFVLLSLPPLALAVLGSVGFVGQRLSGPFHIESVNRLLDLVGTVLTQDAIESLQLERVFTQLVTEPNVNIASLGFVVTIYAASRAIRVVLVAVSIAYDLEDHRPGWKQRALGIGITFVGMVLGIVVVPVLAAGPSFGETIDRAFGVEGLVAPTFRLLYWPGAVILAVLILATLYHVGAPWWTRWRNDIPGAVLAVVLWIAGSAGLRVYTQVAIAGDDLYAPLAGPLVVLLWVYVSAFAVLLGAELNAELERSSSDDDVPHDDDRRERTTPKRASVI